MDLSTTVTSDLTSFLDDLDPVGPELFDALTTLRHDLKAAIPSFQGLRLVIAFEAIPICLTLADDDHRPMTTLELPLWWLSTKQGASSITFYASVPGAFVDLAADLTYGLQLAAGVVELDGAPGRATLAPLTSSLSGLAELTALNRAIGMLLEGGSEEADARAELSRRAVASGRTLAEVARAQVDSWPPRPAG